MAKDNDKDNKSKLLSALLTLLLGGGIVATLLFTSLNYEYPPKDALLQQLQDPIEFGGEDEEFVQFEEMLANADEESAEPGEAIEEQPTEDNPPQETGQNEMENQGTVNEPPQPPVATKAESPMKVPEQPKKDTKPQKETTTPTVTPKPKSQGENKPQTPPTNNQKSEAQKRAEEQMKGMKQGNNGNNSGNNPNGAMGKPTIGGGLGGYTEESFPTSTCPGPGTVVVQVVVSPTGAVTKATVTGGSLKGNARACEICRGLALRSRFRVPKNTAVERKGTLTYTVK